MSNKERLMTVLIQPHVSEKAATVTEKANQYVFRVREDASKAEVKQAAYRHAMVPVKVTKHIVMLCGTNPHDIDGIRRLFNLVATGEQYPIFVLSEPSRIMQALTQFA